MTTNLETLREELAAKTRALSELRTKVESLTHYAGAGRWQPECRMIPRDDVLDLIAAAEKETR